MNGIDWNRYTLDKTEQDGFSLSGIGPSALKPYSAGDHLSGSDLFEVHHGKRMNVQIIHLDETAGFQYQTILLFADS